MIKQATSNDTCKEAISLDTWSAEAIQREDNEPWMHGTIIEHGCEDNNSSSYKIHFTKTWQVITRNMTHKVHTIYSRTIFKG